MLTSGSIPSFRTIVRIWKKSDATAFREDDILRESGVHSVSVEFRAKYLKFSVKFRLLKSHKGKFTYFNKVSIILLI